MKNFWKILRDYGVITVSCLIYALAINWLFQPNQIAMGGFTGISQVLNRVFSWIPVGTAVFFMNVPLMILGVKKQGWSILFATVFATVVSSLMIDALAWLETIKVITFAPMDPLLACLFGGVLLGVSLGWMLVKSATTGGTELAATLLKYKFRSLSIGKICMVIDVAVVCLCAAVFGKLESALYGVVAIYVTTIVMDVVIYGAINAKLAYIISDHCEEITERLMKMELGGTILTGKGAFTGNKKNVIMCAARPAMIAKIKAVVAEVDPDKAFVIVTDAKEVYGEGFGEYSEDNL